MDARLIISSLPFARLRTWRGSKVEGVTCNVMSETQEVVEAGGGGGDEEREDWREREKVMQLFAAVQVAFSEDSERKEV